MNAHCSHFQNINNLIWLKFHWKWYCLHSFLSHVLANFFYLWKIPSMRDFFGFLKSVINIIKWQECWVLDSKMLYKKKRLQELGLAVCIENWFRPLLFAWTYKKSLKNIYIKSCFMQLRIWIKWTGSTLWRVSIKKKTL